MSGNRDALLDWAVELRDALSKAQAVLLGVYAALDDVEKAEVCAKQPFLAAQVNVAFTEVQAFLEAVPWVPEISSPGVDSGEAVAPGGVQ